MEVHKFGGASVKDDNGVKNITRVLKSLTATPKIIVISAMGKTTNAIEEIINSYFHTPEKVKENIDLIKSKHLAIANNLFKTPNHSIFTCIENLFTELEYFLEKNKSPNYDYVYDQVIIYGELLSTKIVSTYLNENNFENTWIDARNLIKTDATYRDAQVNWAQTKTQIQNTINPNKITITQGFIAADEHNFSTSLGREGSDYTAAILAYATNAKSVSIWKDVDGLLNADPRHFENPILLEEISYSEAIELAFYGASVIHPKTLQPLQKKEIPLHIKSFYHPEALGTTVGKGTKLKPEVPCYIVKHGLVLLSLSSLDFSFFVEENISEIFALFHKYQIKVDLIQNSAISFSVCVDNKFNNIDKLITHLQAKFKVSYNKDVSLYTIRHFTPEAQKKIEKNKHVLLKQVTRETLQLITKK